MDKYIKCEDAKAAFCRYMGFTSKRAALAVEAIVDKIPAADVVVRPKWISVEDRLPEEPYGCLLVVWDSKPMGGDDFLNYLPYFAGYDGERWNDGDGEQVPFEVAFWMPLPELPERG